MFNRHSRPFSRARQVPRLEILEDRAVPAGLFLAGVGGLTQPADPEVSIYATVGTSANSRLNGFQAEAFGGTTGDTRVALGDVNGDGTDDLIAGSGFGAQAEVVIFDGAQALKGVTKEIARFTAYSNFQGGIFVAAGDLDHDGKAEVMTTPGLGGRGHLKVFKFADANGTFLGSNPTIPTSAYTFTDYNGEIRVATMKVGGEVFVVTASGAGVPGDVRAFRNAQLIGQLADGTPVPANFLAARLVPFGGYSGGLSVAAGDTNGDGNDELFIAKNSGASTIEVYNANFPAAGVGSLNFLTTTPEAFPGFQGEVRLGAADVDGDGDVEVLATTGFSGDPKGTPVKALARTGNSFAEIRAFYSNPGYLPGAWLAGKDFVFAQDVKTFKVIDNNANSTLPATFESNPPVPSPTTRQIQDVAIAFPEFDGGQPLPAETITGAALPFRNIEVSLAFNHAFPGEATVTLVYSPGNGGASSFFTLFNGPANPGRTFSSLQATFSDNAPGTIPNGTTGTLTGRFQADGGSLRNFINSLPDRTGRFVLIFEDSVMGDSGTVPVSPSPFIRLFY